MVTLADVPGKLGWVEVSYDLGFSRLPGFRNWDAHHVARESSERARGNATRDAWQCAAANRDPAATTATAATASTD